jgi:hypothetical protein
MSHNGQCPTQYKCKWGGISKPAMTASISKFTGAKQGILDVVVASKKLHGGHSGG